MDNEELTEMRQIHEWILSYTCYTTLKNYSRNGDIELERDFIQGVLSSVKEYNDKTSLEVQILIVLCRLVDGHDHCFQYEGIDGDITPLEDVLQRITPLIEEWNDYFTEPDTALLVIKRQAVVTCCRRNDFHSGISVFKRLEKSFKSNEEKELAKQLKEMIESQDVKHQMIRQHPYSEIHQAVTACLDPLICNMETPFLIRAAKRMMAEKNNKGVADQTSCKQSKSINTGLVIAPPLSELLDHDFEGGFYLRGNQEKQFSLKRKHIQQNKDEYLARIPDILCQSASTKAGNKTPVKENCTERTSLRSNVKESSPNLPERLNFNPANGKRPRRSLVPQNRLTRSYRSSQKLMWMPYEEDALYKAVLKCGVGNWADVVRVAKFVDRTNVQVKDKWRTMTNPKFRSRLKELRDLYGAIPGFKY